MRWNTWHHRSADRAGRLRAAAFAAGDRAYFASLLAEIGSPDPISASSGPSRRAGRVEQVKQVRYPGPPLRGGGEFAVLRVAAQLPEEGAAQVLFLDPLH